MWKVKDLERMLARVYTFSIQSQAQIVYEEMIWNLRLTEFRKTLQILDQLMDLKINTFDELKHNFKCERLRMLCTHKHVAEAPPASAIGDKDVDMKFDLEEEGGRFHNYIPILKPFQACIEWEKIENDKFMPRPMKGMDAEIDEILLKMDKIKTEIRDLLEETRKKFNCDKITFASNRKYRY